MSSPPGTAEAHLDHEQILSAAKAALGAATNILALTNMPHALAQTELDEIASDLTEALHDVLAWMPARDSDANQLLGACVRFLP